MFSNENRSKLYALKYIFLILNLNRKMELSNNFIFLCNPYITKHTFPDALKICSIYIGSSPSFCARDFFFLIFTEIILITISHRLSHYICLYI